MKTLPTIAILGRPNVGKSSLFNRILQKKAAIVADKEGVTRDRLVAEGEFQEKPFFLIDTGGIEDPTIPFSASLQQQAEVALEEADILFVVVDGTVGPTLLDERVIKKVYPYKKPLYLIVNKIDTSEQEERVKHLFYSLGVPSVFFVSCLHNRNMEELMETATASFSERKEEEKGENIRVSIIGRPNVGKSTLLNAILGSPRAIVSPLAGTTRDAIDETLVLGEKKYRFIDTAGIRKKKQAKEVEDWFSTLQAEKAIERSHLCLLLIDSTLGMSLEEKRLLQKIEEKGKGCLLLLNKWDLVKKTQMEHFLKELRRYASFSQFVPTLFISAKEGRNIDKILPEIDRVYENLCRQIATPELNQFFSTQLEHFTPPAIGGKRFKVFYAVQVGKRPPQFTLFVNQPQLLAGSYKKYLIHQLRKQYDFLGCPLWVRCKARRLS